MNTRILHHPAPARHWVQAPNGHWSSQPWDIHAVMHALEGGAWFKPGAHDFDSKETASFAVSHSIQRG